MATATLDDLISRTRLKANVARSNFVTDDEIIVYLNEGLREFRELVITADDSYYVATMADFSISAAPGNEKALPSDFWKLRGLDGFAGDSLRQAEVYAREFRNRFDPGVGYYFGGDGNSIVICGRSAEQANPYRVTYTPDPVPFAALAPYTARTIAVSGADGTNGGSQFSMANGAFSIADVGATIVIANNTGNIPNGTYTVTGVSSATLVSVNPLPPAGENFGIAATATLTGDKTQTRTFNVASPDNATFFDTGSAIWSLQNGAFGIEDVGSYLTTSVSNTAYSATYKIIRVASATSVQVTPTTPGSSGAVTGTASISRQPGSTRSALDLTENRFSEYFSVRAAMVIARKKRQDSLVAQLAAERGDIEQRIADLSKMRQSEPQQAPLLWGRRSRYDRDDLDV